MTLTSETMSRKTKVVLGLACLVPDVFGLGTQAAEPAHKPNVMFRFIIQAMHDFCSLAAPKDGSSYSFRVSYFMGAFIRAIPSLGCLERPMRLG